MGKTAGKSPGHVYLIGAGPGDPGLLTLRGADCLSRCDVVLYDGLSNPDILRHAAMARQNGLCISVGKHGGGRIWTQREIVDEILMHAGRGRVVGRLKGGDPAVFARSAEEIDACVEANIDFELIPGITAALAAGSYAGIPITHRGIASAVALVTGHEEPGKSESAIDWDALAKFPGTLVIYMGVTTAAAWTSALIRAGKDPATPTALVRRCSHPDQQEIHCRLDEVVEQLTPASKFRPPVITIIGPVTTLANTMHWLRGRPLFGQTVLVTRAEAKSSDLHDRLQQFGARVLSAPAIEIAPLDDPSPIDQVIERIGDFDALIFSSNSGVSHFMNRLMMQADSRKLAGIAIGAIGPKTADSLTPFGLTADMVPQRSSADGFVAQFANALSGKRVLLVRASRGSDVLADGLASQGASVDSVIAYQHRDVDQWPRSITTAIDSGEIHWITVTSSATAKSVCRLMGDRWGPNHRSDVSVASLSPITTSQLESLGVPVDVTAEQANLQSLVEAIAEKVSSSPTEQP